MAMCTICGFVTEFLEQHMSNNGDERNFKCDKCEKVVIGKKRRKDIWVQGQERIWDTLKSLIWPDIKASSWSLI